MFGTKPREPTYARARDAHLTGVERAKLERAHAPDVAVAPKALPEPVLPPQLPAQPAALAPAPPPTPVRAPVSQEVRPASAEPRPVNSDSRLVVRQPTPVPQAAHKAQLIVGEGVGLKGDIFNCDMLRVEGTVEGNVKARKLTIAAAGTLLGTAQITEADIEGRFEGILSASGLLAIRGTGLVTGKIGYEHIEIDRGGPDFRRDPGGQAGPVTRCAPSYGSRHGRRSR